MDVRGSFVSGDGLEVVHVADDRILEGYAVGTEDLSGRARHIEGCVDVTQLSHAHVLGPQGAGILHATQMEREKSGAINVERHRRQLLLLDLEGGDRLSELGPIGAVVERRFEAGPRCARCAPDNAVTRLVQTRQWTGERLGLRKHRPGWEADVVKK